MDSTNPELAVWLLLVLLYLSDGFVLLFLNEALLFESSKTFTASTNDLRFEIRKKRLYLLNPFLPHVLIYRVPWGLKRGTADEAEVDVEVVRRCTVALRNTKQLCVILGTTLLVAFPLLSLLIGFSDAFITCGVIGYSVAFVAVASVIGNRHRLSVKTSHLISSLVVMFLCLPYGINLSRRISLAVEIKSDAAEILPRMLNPSDYQEVVKAIVRRAKEELELGLEESTADSLKSYLNSAFPE